MSATPTLDLGDLRRVTPIDTRFGEGRGKPLDRHYIERFLEANAAHIRGRVLEVADDVYTRRFGGDRVQARDVIHADPSHPRATVFANLADAQDVPSDTYDCFICTQTLTYIYPVQRALETVHRILKPGGVLLATVPGISQISPYDRDRWGEYWRFTSQSLRRLLGEVFLPEHVAVETYGNVLASTAFLQGLAVEDLRPDELDHHDQRYEMLIAGRAVKEPTAA
ncbi:MAG TPA: methyltransferase domain-containing protein [Caldimonas sp.]|nr:methyltransferase domain-containing protein [Caldimonas sp.]